MPHLFEDIVFIEDVPFAILMKLSGNLAKASLCKHRAKQPTSHPPQNTLHILKRINVKSAIELFTKSLIYRDALQVSKLLSSKNSSENFSYQLASPFVYICLNK